MRVRVPRKTKKLLLADRVEWTLRTPAGHRRWQRFVRWEVRRELAS